MMVRMACWVCVVMAAFSAGVQAQVQWQGAAEDAGPGAGGMSCMDCHALPGQAANFVYAQEGGVGAQLDELLRPDFLRSDLRLLGESLQLDEVQRAIVLSLLDDYLQEFFSEAEALRSALRHMEARIRASIFSDGLFLDQLKEEEIDQADQLHQGLIREMLQELREAELHPEHEPESVARMARIFWSDKKAMRAQLVHHLSLILNEDQVESLELAIAIVRCTNDLPRGRYGGESLNVALLLDVIPEPASIDTQTVGRLVRAWFIDAAEAIRHRNTVLIEHEIERLALIEVDDIGQRISMARRESDSRVRVREINRSSVQRIADAMHPEEADVLQTESLRRSFPRVFNPTTPARVLASALALRELEPETVEALRSIQEDYIRQVDALNEQIVLSTLAEEPREYVERLKYLQSKQIPDPGWIAGEVLQPPTMPRTSDLFEERRTVGLGTLKQLSAMLTPGQVELLMSK